MSRDKAEVPWRLPRYDVELPMEYRSAGDDGWHAAKTINFSRSGLLFEADTALSPNTPIELTFGVPSPDHANAHASIVCKARIVRASQGRRLAAKISSYQFVRGKSEPIRTNGRAKQEGRAHSRATALASSG